MVDQYAYSRKHIREAVTVLHDTGTAVVGIAALAEITREGVHKMIRRRRMERRGE
mgnify:CR=1 FL=1